MFSLNRNCFRNRINLGSVRMISDKKHANQFFNLLILGVLNSNPAMENLILRSSDVYFNLKIFIKNLFPIGNILFRALRYKMTMENLTLFFHESSWSLSQLKDLPQGSNTIILYANIFIHKYIIHTEIPMQCCVTRNLYINTQIFVNLYNNEQQEKSSTRAE